jgi:hypothetical protein
MKLELCALLLQLCICLLNVEQALHQFRFGHLYVAISGAIHITVWVNSQRLCDRLLGLSLPHLSVSIFRSLICGTVFAIIGMSLSVLQNCRLFDAPAFCIYLDTFATDGLNRDRLLLADELIDGGLDEADGPLAFLLVVFLEPGAGLRDFARLGVGWRFWGHRLRHVDSPP